MVAMPATRPATAAMLADALARCRVVGPYFAVETGPMDGPVAVWQPLSDLIDRPVVLRTRVAVARAAMATSAGAAESEVDERAAASVWFQGLASRFVSVALGAAALAGVVPVLEPHRVAWRPTGGGPLPLALTDPAGRVADQPDRIPAPTAALAALVHAHVIDTAVAPVLAAVRREFGVSPRVLWGNTASAVVGAARMLAAATPSATAPATALARAVLARPPLADAGDLGTTGLHAFTRRSCCLYYRTPGGGLCGDCVLRTRDRRRTGTAH